jgi:hypothetical protein
MPSTSLRILRPITVAVGDHNLYVMSVADGTPQFVALVDARDPNSRYTMMPSWQWQYPKLSPFPSRSYDDYLYYKANGTRDPFEIGAYTVVGDAQILVSTVDAGTFSFDTKSGQWSKAGEWALPFRGCAEYVPEHKL